MRASDAIPWRGRQRRGGVGQRGFNEVPSADCQGELVARYRRFNGIAVQELLRMRTVSMRWGHEAVVHTRYVFDRRRARLPVSAGRQQAGDIIEVLPDSGATGRRDQEAGDGGGVVMLGRRVPSH